jgi:hypothetical protein
MTPERSKGLLLKNTFSVNDVNEQKKQTLLDSFVKLTSLK